MGVLDDQASTSVVDSLLQRLSDHSSPLNQPDGVKLAASGELRGSNPGLPNDNSSNGSVPITPGTEEFVVTPSTEPETQPVVIDAVDLRRLKNELEDARNEVARMNQELHTTHQIKSTFDHAIGQSSEADYYYKGDVTEQTISHLQSKFNASTRPGFGRQESWPTQDDVASEKSDAKSFNGQAIWGNAVRQQQYPPMNGWGASMQQQNLGPIQVCASTSRYTTLWSRPVRL
jgi:hypothetical protein